MHQFIYQSPLGSVVLLSQDGTLPSTYLLDGQIPPSYLEKESPDLQVGNFWLRAHFRGDPLALDDLPLVPQGTLFQRNVWVLLREVLYGQVTSYGALARVLTKEYRREKMSTQAVGAALTKNPPAIVLLCHRILGGENFFRGYVRGLETKKALLGGEGLKIVQDKVTQPSFALSKGL